MNTANDYIVKLKKSDWKIIGYFYLVFAIVLFIEYLEENEPVGEVCLFFASNAIFTVLIVVIMVYLIIPKFIIEKKQIFLFSISTLLMLDFFGMIDFTVDWWIRGDNWNDFPPALELIFYNVFSLADTVGLLLGVFLYKNLYETLIKNSEIEKARKENELKLLRSQLDPHFLFNNLNGLSALVDIDTELAKEYIDKLSNIYRYLINTKDQDTVELQKEIELAEDYIFLIKMRFGNSYHFSFKNEATDLDTKFIPTGALQTLLENVIKHNITTLKLCVNTTITITNDTLTIYNTKTKHKAETTSFGTGLKNLQKRYYNLSYKKISIEDTEDYFSVTMPIINTIKR